MFSKNEIHLKFVSILITIFSNIITTNGYSSGAPTRACTSMVPEHGSPPQDSDPPYHIGVRLDQNSVFVQISGKNGSKFTGFFIQTRSVENRNKIISGVFSEEKSEGLTQIKSCNSDRANSLTHRNAVEKTRIETEWIPPQRFSGQIVFRVTVVQTKPVFWVDFDSEVIAFESGKPVKKSGVEFMSQKSENTPEMDFSVCSKRFCTGMANNGNNECATDKSCVVLVSGQKSGDNSGEIQGEFEIQAKSLENNKYYSMGFSRDNKMGDEFVFDCLLVANKPMLSLSYNSGKNNIPEENELKISEKLRPISAEYVNGVLKCRFFVLKNKDFDLLTDNYYILTAIGSLVDGLQKEYHSRRSSTSSTVDLSVKGSVAVRSDAIYLVRLHSSLMTFSWLALISVSILIGRHFKQTFNSQLLCGVKLWFAFHRSLNLIAISLMILAQISIFYYLDFEYKIGAHQLLGSVAFGIALFQPFGALFRPHPDASNRWVFNWFHWLFGNVAHILAILAIFLATDLDLADLPNKPFLWTMICFVIFYVFFHILLQIHSFFIQKRKSHEIALQEMNTNFNQIPEHEIGEQEDESGTGFRRFILGIFSLIVLMFVLTLISLITLEKKTLEKMSII